MNHLLDSAREREMCMVMDKASSDALDPFFPKHEISDGLDEQRLLVAAMDMTRQALADDAKPDVEQEEPVDATTGN